MGYGRKYTEEDKWLSQLVRLTRIQASAIINGGGTASGLTISQFTIGDGNPGTPVDGATVYANPLMDGKTVHIFKNGVGYLTEGTASGEYQLVSGGGFELQGGSVFSTDETYLVFIQ